MFCLHRRVTRKGRDGLEYNDTEIDADVITLGSGADQTIVLGAIGISARHAKLYQRDNGSIEIQSYGNNKILVNGEKKKSTIISTGDVIQIGGSVLEVLPDVPGFDLAFQTELSESVWGAGEEEERIDSEITTGWLTKTRLSWYLSLGILIVLLIIPTVGLINEDVQKSLRGIPYLPSDNIWSTGELSAAHKIPDIGEDCTVCHVKPFRRVMNDACHACHKNVKQHVPEDSVHAMEFTEMRCTICHKEHKEPSRIVFKDQDLCTDCHENISNEGEKQIDVSSVKDFDGSHPEFRLSMYVLDDNDQDVWRQKRIDIQDPLLHEESNLKFTHKEHLNPEGIETMDGRVVMVCDDCHIPDASGALMQSITMEGQCRECHSLAFDETMPGRELPHGDLPDVIASLEEYFSRIGLEKQPDVKLPEKRLRTVRIPGKKTDTNEPETVLQWAKQEARVSAEEIFERTLCNTCHEINRSSIEFDEIPKWKVVPVKISDRWMPRASFSHRDHQMQECTDCHHANESEESNDVLMPSIEVCQECHGGADSKTKLSSSCISCHYLHNPAMEMLSIQ